MKYIRGIEVKRLAPTNTKGTRIKLKDYDETVTIHYRYTSNIITEAMEHLKNKGFNIIGYTELKNIYVILTDSNESIK